MSGAELGSTSDPRVLVPGDPGAVVRSVWSLRELGDSLSSAGRGLSRLDTEDGWRGAAADAFRERYSAEPPRWREAGECFHDDADAVDRYADALQRGQRQAAEAVEWWNRGQTLTAAATAEFERAARQVNAEFGSRAVAGVVTAAPVLTFVDPGEEHRARARSELERARAQVRTAGDDARRSVLGARDRAPGGPGFWSPVGDLACGVGEEVVSLAGAVVDGAASFGTAMARHPGDVAALVAGVALMGVGAGGEVLGGALDATGIGALGGVPLNVVSAGVIAAGAGVAAVAVGDLGRHAVSDDRVSPTSVFHWG